MTKRILIVEDEASLLQAIAVCLRTEGYELYRRATAKTRSPESFPARRI